MTKLAAQLYSVRMHMQTPEDIDRGFERLAEDGWKVVQASGLGPIAPCDLKALADKYGLSICATHIPLAALQNDLDGVLRDHVLLDRPYIGLGAMPWEYATTFEASSARRTSSMKASRSVTSHVPAWPSNARTPAAR